MLSCLRPMLGERHMSSPFHLLEVIRRLERRRMVWNFACEATHPVAVGAWTEAARSDVLPTVFS